MHWVVMDTLGPLPEAAHGKMYILVMGITSLNGKSSMSYLTWRQSRYQESSSMSLSASLESLSSFIQIKGGALNPHYSKRFVCCWESPRVGPPSITLRDKIIEKFNRTILNILSTVVLDDSTTGTYNSPH